MSTKKAKDEQPPQRLSDPHEPAPHVERRETIVSTFLEHGGNDSLEAGSITDPKVSRQRRYYWGNSKSWMEYWDDRENIYRAPPKKKLEKYDPPASEQLVATAAYFPVIVFFLPIVIAVAYKGQDKPGFIQFHLKQGFNLLITCFFLSMIYAIGILLVDTFMPAAPVLNSALLDGVLRNPNDIFFILLSLVWFFPLWLMGSGIARASKGRWEALPWVGKDILAD